MPRTSRLVIPGAPHHVTQRGNRREQVFFSDADHRAYLKWLREYAGRYGAEILAYCLMPNHSHLIVVPRGRDSLHRIFRHLHMRYAQNLNRRHGWVGHVWQGRYFASVLGESHFWSAIRYVELNPVRAGMVRRAEDYPWSSARSHCGIRDDHTLTPSHQWSAQFEGIGDWSAWLAAGDDPKHLSELRAHTDKGLPCGSPAFIKHLEATTGRILRPRRAGRPRLGARTEH